MIDGKPDFTKLTEIQWMSWSGASGCRELSSKQPAECMTGWLRLGKEPECLLAQLVRLVEKYIDSGRVVVDPPIFNSNDKLRRLFFTLNMTKDCRASLGAIRFENALTLEPIFDKERPIRSTGDMLPWYSSKPCEHTQRSHINMCVYDSRWEANESLELDRNANVRAWVKNDHIGFEITYSFKGIIHKFRPIT